MAASAGALLHLVRDGEARSRAELAELTGLGRSTISQRVGMLLSSQYLREVGDGESTGGRPPRLLEFNAHAAVVLVGDIGATHARLAVADLSGTPLASSNHEIEIGAGPDHVLGWAMERFDELLEEVGRPPADVAAVGLGVPGPVEFAAGRVVNPPIMPGWDQFPIRMPLAERYGAPVLVDNDVNIMALGEYWTGWRGVEDMLYVKLGTGIGCGIIAGGHIHRGANGAAGDIGHIRLADSNALCRCGNEGCLEAVAGGAALAAQLREIGLDARHTRDVVEHVRVGESHAARIVRGAGRALGEVLAGLINFFNPAVIVLGGDLAQAHEQVFAGVREVAYQRSTALATRHLEFARSTLGEDAGIIGAAVLATEHVLSPAAIDGSLV